MNYEHGRDNFQGALVAVLLLVLVVGVALVGVGYVFWTRVSVAQEWALRAEVMARQEAEMARSVSRDSQLREMVESAEAASSLEIEIDSNGVLTIDGQQTDSEQLEKTLQQMPGETKRIRILLSADENCTMVQLKPIIDLCQSYGEFEFKFDSKEASE